MEYLSNDKILVVDLGNGDVEEEELSEDLVAERIGGAGVNAHLYGKYAGDDPIVLGVGLLTGTMYPASAASVLTAKSPVTGKLCHCPVTLKVGIEIKYAGFDYIVIKGRSDKPVYLWIHDGVADIADAADVWGKDVWETTDAWRKQVGDDLLQTLVIGPAGEKGLDCAQVCYNYWTGPDRFGIGKLFGQRHLKGMAFRGMGLLEAAEPEDFVDEAFELLDAVKGNDFMSKKGLGPICGALGEADAEEWLSPVVHRHSADYFTPYATNTFAFIDEDPATVTETAKPAPGVLISDIPALLAFKKLGLSALDAAKAMRACARQGVDPLAAATAGGKAGKTAIDDILAQIAAATEPAAIEGNGVFSPWCPGKPIFGDFGESDTGAWWERRQAVAAIFGIQPVFAVMCPQLTEESLISLSNIGGELELDQETLDTVVDDIAK